MSGYSKVILSNGKEYIVPIQPSLLIEKHFMDREGGMYNKFIRVPQIDRETGDEVHLTVNPQHIATIEEVSIRRRQPSIPSVFRVETKKGK
ncbi:hypothetical protein CN404_12725 [Bacillus thuringiensis]|uniref:hypothetical protein n=1 Tax=Bacillus thuringiensis TaxID=1428 RepID=UPI000BF3A9B6|nr:hypothetical protein [Bacillus thuringiensis]PFB53808.1 hypothetical protein CN404_12725 [Bacillus thuringiensis]